jgi:allophanate hydrolase
MPEPDSLNFTFAGLHGAYSSGARPEAVLEQVFRRIEASADPGIFISLASLESLRAEASKLPPFDPESLPLWGIPVAVKDNIDVAGFATTAACPDFAYRPERDAEAVARLRRAGALIIGKTNLDQFATGLVGVRTPYPVPRNACDAELVPGGSSSGSAVAVARGIVTLALGTDTAGSGRVPATLNNIVGLKPSLGAVSTRGVVPACRTLDCVSVFALTVADAWAGFRAMSGYDADDPFSRQRPAAAFQLFPPSLRVGVPAKEDRIFHGDGGAESAYEAGLAALSELGAEILPIPFADFFAVGALLYEGAWVAERYAAIRTFIEARPDSLHPITRKIIGAAAGLTASEAFEGIYKLKEIERRIEPVWSDVDMLCVPSIPSLCTLADVEADPIGSNSRLGTYANFVNLLDLCAIAVPAGSRPDERPNGVTLIGRAGDDGTLAGVARDLHAATMERLGATAWAITPTAISSMASSDEMKMAVGAHPPA